MKKKHYLIFATITAIFTVSCASTPSSQETDGNFQNSEAVSTDTNANSENKDTSETMPEEKSQDKNPLTAIIEQNLPENIIKTTTAEKAEKSAEQISENQKVNNEEIQFSAQEEDFQEKNPAETKDPEIEKIADEDLAIRNFSENPPVQSESNFFSEPEVIDIAEEPELFEDKTEQAEYPEENDGEASSENEGENGDSQNKKIEEALETRPEFFSETEKTENNDAIAEETEKNGEVSQAPQSLNEINSEKTVSEDSQKENPAKKENLPAEDKNTNGREQISQQKNHTPSRKVTIKRGQYLDVVYPGNGWIYIGESATPELLTYFGRITDSSATTFTLHSSDPGETFLHFYKDDALTGNSIDDYLMVTIEDKKAAPNEKTTAPSYAQIAHPQFKPRQTTVKTNSEKRNESNQNSQPENSEENEENSSRQLQENIQDENSAVKSYIQDPKAEKEISSDNIKMPVSTPEEQKSLKNGAYASSSGENSENKVSSASKISEKKSSAETEQQNFTLEPEVQVFNQAEDQTESEESQSAEELLEKAKSLFEEKKYAESLEYCREFINSSNERLDEAYYLLGEIYETESSVKNIRNAVDAYTTVTKYYPLSKFWKKANQRNVYLRRFYIDIR